LTLEPLGPLETAYHEELKKKRKNPPSAFVQAVELEIEGGNAQIEKEWQDAKKRIKERENIDDIWNRIEEAPMMREFDTGATRDIDTDKLDYDGFLSPTVLRAFAEYMHEHRVQSDGSLRDSDNWQKGIPQDEYMKSMFRHFMETWFYHRNPDEQDSEHGNIVDSLCALLFNVMGYLHEELK